MKRIVWINTVVLLVLAGMVIWQTFSPHKSKVVYVDSIKLFNACQLKKDLYKGIEQTFGNKMATMDSLENSAASGKLTAEQIHQFEIDRETLSQEITAAKNGTDRSIWERLNLVIKKLGEQEKYELIIGANGMGTVLYGGPQQDITDIVIQYANKEYKDK